MVHYCYHTVSVPYVLDICGAVKGEPMQNYKMIIEYDGTRYQGFQAKSNTAKGAANTISFKLQEALRTVTGEQTEIHVAVRTSPGVHAAGQTVSFWLNRSLNEEALGNSESGIRQKLNRILPQDIAVRSIYPAEERFDAALNLQSATFLCRLDVGEIPNIFWQNRSVHIPETLDLEKMEQAAKLLCGRHDFAPFMAGRTKKNTVRSITELSLFEDRELHQLVFSVTANSFLRHMPQLLSGTLVDVGRGKIPFENVEQILDGTVPCGDFLPSKSFCLTETNYL